MLPYKEFWYLCELIVFNVLLVTDGKPGLIVNMGDGVASFIRLLKSLKDYLRQLYSAGQKNTQQLQNFVSQFLYITQKRSEKTTFLCKALNICIVVGAWNLYIEKAQTALDILCFAVFFGSAMYLTISDIF